MRTYGKDVVHQQLQRSNLVIVDRLREVQSSQDLTQDLLVLLCVAVIMNIHKTTQRKTCGTHLSYHP